jgi:hypothetical protein
MIDNNIIEQARNADIISFFEKYHGFTFAHQGGAYRCKEHESLAVKGDRLSWYWHSKGLGGFGAIDYLIKVENMSFRDAVTVITGTTPITVILRHDEAVRVRQKRVVLPEKAGIPLHLYEYLCNKRGIDGDIVSALIQREMLYEDRRGNVVFVGHDEHGEPRFASVRGTQGNSRFRGDCAESDKRYSFFMAANAPTERLYIFESPIDAMSHASLVNAAEGGTGAWKRDSRLSLAGTNDTALNFFLNQHKAVKELVFCLDNDEPGRTAAVVMARKYACNGYVSLNEQPKGKDFNEDLQALRARVRAEKRTRTQNNDISI